MFRGQPTDLDLKEALYAIPWPDPVFVMDQYFDFVLDHYNDLLNDGGRPFPNFSTRLLKHYRHVIECSKHMKENTIKGDAYLHLIPFPELKSSYSIAWSHNKLDEIQRRRMKQSVKIPTKELFEQSGKKDEIDWQYAMSLEEPFDPIHCIAYTG